jgi:ubiquinone/menaquinone biosynthesis C-methylase UbiE
MEPDFYNKYYEIIEDSHIHSLFCKTVFGIDLCQQGFTDLQQIKLIADCIEPGQTVIDIGCGNGRITEYLQEQTGGNFTGLDNSIIAIDRAIRRTKNTNKQLIFIYGDINDLQLPAGEFDVVFLIDTIYFSTNYDQTISWLKELLKPNGAILIFYSIGPALLQSWTFPKDMLDPNKTPLAQVLTNHGFIFDYTDLTIQEHELARKRKAFLEIHKDEFEAENINFVYNNRIGDSTGFLHALEDGLHRRFLYKARLLD